MSILKQVSDQKMFIHNPSFQKTYSIGDLLSDLSFFDHLRCKLTLMPLGLLFL